MVTRSDADGANRLEDDDQPRSSGSVRHAGTLSEHGRAAASLALVAVGALGTLALLASAVAVSAGLVDAVVRRHVTVAVLSIGGAIAGVYVLLLAASASSRYQPVWR